MTRKCDTCRHFEPVFYVIGADGQSTTCRQPTITLTACLPFVPLNQARDICDREGDGHFVYFEPIQPEAGAALEISDFKSQIPASGFVQITREPTAKAMSAGGCV